MANKSKSKWYVLDTYVNVTTVYDDRASVERYLKTVMDERFDVSDVTVVEGVQHHVTQKVVLD